MHHLIVNPTAGKKKMHQLVERIKSVFDKGKLDYDIHYTTHVRDAEEVSRELTSKGEKDIVVVGGDGTLHETLNGLVDPTDCRLGLIPAGTGNDFAESAKIPLEVEEAASLIVKGETKETDYLEVGGVRCMNVAGLGLDVDVLERCEKGKMQGKLKYVKCLLQSVFSYKGCNISFERDGMEVSKKVLIAATCNGKQIGGGIKICPKAEISDGKMDVVVVDFLGNFFSLIGALMQLMKGKILEHPAANHFLCDKIKILSAVPQTVQLDGELYRNLPFEVTLKRGLKMYR